MNTSSEMVIHQAAAAFCGRPPEAITFLPGGRNNVVAKVTWQDRVCLGKHYFRHPGDPRDRLGTEFAFGRFAWDHGVRSLPEPLYACPELGVAFYQFIPGRRLAAAEINAAHVEQFAAFLGRLWQLASIPAATRLPPAAEALFSPADTAGMLARRLSRLLAAVAEPAADIVHDRAAIFVCTELQAAVMAAQELLLVTSDHGWPWADRVLPVALRTLSPADYGFHNALLQSDGKLVFLDFEHAGWDDPALMLVSAGLHAEIPLPPEWQPIFVRAVLAAARVAPGSWSACRCRLRPLAIAVALKWATITLNGLVPVDATRRRFAADPDSLAVQLDKSRRYVRQAQAWIDGAPLMLEGVAAT